MNEQEFHPDQVLMFLIPFYLLLNENNSTYLSSDYGGKKIVEFLKSSLELKNKN